jgi:hypothetical protein
VTTPIGSLSQCRKCHYYSTVVLETPHINKFSRVSQSLFDSCSRAIVSFTWGSFDVHVSWLQAERCWYMYFGQGRRLVGPYLVRFDLCDC